MDWVQNIIQEVEKLKARKDFSRALEVIESALTSHNDDYRLYEEIADIYLYEWKMAKAKKAIDFAMNMNPKSPTGNYLKWFILLSYNKIDEAIHFLETSNTLMANNAEVLRNLGWWYAITGQSQKWIAILKRALNISPGDRLITEDLAMALIGVWKIKQWNEMLEKIGKSKISI